MSTQYLPLNWASYCQLVDNLAYKILINKKSESLDKIVGISRCGLTLGHLLSDYLQKPVGILAIQSYVNIQKSRPPKLLGDLSMPIRNENILLVDGISDSGNTLLKATKYLEKNKPKTITTATLFYKPHSKLEPDFYVEKSNDWILFPYEATEWIITFTNNMLKEGKTKKEIYTFLSSLGYTKKQISSVYKYYL